MYDEFLEKAKARAMKRSVGDPFKKGIEQGPQVLFQAEPRNSLVLNIIPRFVSTFALHLVLK